MGKPKNRTAPNKIAKLETSVAAWRSKALSLRQQNANLIKLVEGLYRELVSRSEGASRGVPAKRPPRKK